MRGHIRKNGKKWANVIYLGIDSNGKKRYKWFSGYKSQKEAEDNLFKDMQRAEKYLHDEKDMTVKQLFEDWFENYAKKKYAYRTYENYKCLAENNLLPELGDEKVIHLTTYKIQRFVNKLEGAPATIKKNLSILKVMLDQAIRWELLDKNPCQNVTTPSIKKQEMDVWDEDTVFRFLKELEGDKLYMPFILALTAGLRQGEICGLRWEDYNIKQGRIHIVRSMQRNMEPKDTKTSSGRRSIKLLSTTIKALEKQKEWQKVQADLFTDEYTNTGYICTMDNGQPMNPGYLQKRFTVLKKRYKLPDIRFHDLRHSFATMLLRNQVNPKIVQEMLGHSNVQTTLNVYSHVLPDMQDEAAKRLENALFNK